MELAGGLIHTVKGSPGNLVTAMGNDEDETKGLNYPRRGGGVTRDKSLEWLITSADEAL